MSSAEESRPDEELLEQTLKTLKISGRIEYTGEYGEEITTFLPLVGWLHEQGLLNGREVLTYRGMEPYYFFLDPAQMRAEKTGRRYIKPHLRTWPTNDTHTATLKPWHRPPDYRAHYLPRARRYDLPTLFVQNKFQVEWHEGPINYLPLVILELVFKTARPNFQVVYSRPGISSMGAGYVGDHNELCQYPDAAVARRHPEVVVLEDLVAKEGRPYNEVKLEMLAGAYNFLTVQGGGAHILAAFGNSLLAILHRRGLEYPHAYHHGPYRYLAKRPPRLALARNDDELVVVLRTLFREILFAG